MGLADAGDLPPSGCAMMVRNGESSPARFVSGTKRGLPEAMGQNLQLLPGGTDDRGTLHLLYQRYGSQILARCVYLLRDRQEAEDAMQEVYAKALNHLSEFRAESSPLTWLLRIATHHCLNVIRSNRAMWRDEVERMAQVAPAGRGGATELEGRELVRTLLARFDTETQTAAIHYYVDEMTLEEVAAAIGRSVPTVRKRLAIFADACRQEILRRSGLQPSLKSEANHG
jgi:RNA polymerase sigma-70 factor (ECF subfamily)